MITVVVKQRARTKTLRCPLHFSKLTLSFMVGFHGWGVVLVTVAAEEPLDTVLNFPAVGPYIPRDVI